VNCPNCNTRVGDNDRSCPNCGRRVVRSKSSGAVGSSRTKSGLVSPSAMTVKSPDDSATDSDFDTEEIELDEETEIELEEPADPGDTGAGGRSNSDSATQGMSGSGAGDTPGVPTPASVRRMLAEDPEILEEGLRVYSDKKGSSVGVNFSTPVGRIDLLARDANECYVVVLVANVGREADLASQILQRMGWVGKHLGNARKAVRGVIVASEVPESLLYAAAALPDGVAIVTYRMALTFEAVEV
jgi:hypothetical protein